MEFLITLDIELWYVITPKFSPGEIYPEPPEKV